MKNVKNIAFRVLYNSNKIALPLASLVTSFLNLVTKNEITLKYVYRIAFYGQAIFLSNVACKYLTETSLNTQTLLTYNGITPLLIGMTINALLNDLTLIKNKSFWIASRIKQCPISTVSFSALYGVCGNIAFNYATYSLAPLAATAIANTLGCSTYTKTAQLIIGFVSLAAITVFGEYAKVKVCEKVKESYNL